MYFSLEAAVHRWWEVTVGVQEPGSMELALLTDSRSVSCSPSFLLLLDARRDGATYRMHATLMAIINQDILSRH